MSLLDDVLNGQLARLQLPYFAQHCAELTALAAREAWPPLRLLEQLVRVKWRVATTL